jgi:hypothetical protein
MADLSLQFHILPEEIIPLVCSFVEEVQAHVIAIRFHPFDVRLFDKENLAAVFGHPDVRRIAFTMKAPTLSGHTMNTFLDDNPGTMLLDIGRRQDVGFEESWLSSRTDDAATLATFRKLAKKIRSVTITGVVAINSQTGATAKLRDHRFSPGAKALEREGVPILTVTGVRLRFPQ